MEVLILSGLPGSGKSTWVKKNYPNAIVVSADSYFVHGGVYRFDPSKIKEAHNCCLGSYILALSSQHAKSDSVLIVDNTNLSSWEYAPYYRLAEYYCWDVKVVEFDTPFEVCCGRNVHGVPRHTMELMRDRLAKDVFPPHWRRLVIRSDGVIYTP